MIQHLLNPKIKYKNWILCDLSLENEGYCFTKYADDTTPYAVQKNKTNNQKPNNTIEVVENLTNFIQKLFTRFASNQMKANPDKCHLLLSRQEEANTQIANTNIESSR